MVHKNFSFSDLKVVFYEKNSMGAPKNSIVTEFLQGKILLSLIRVDNSDMVTCDFLTNSNSQFQNCAEFVCVYSRLKVTSQKIKKDTNLTSVAAFKILG